MLAPFVSASANEAAGVPRPDPGDAGGAVPNDSDQQGSTRSPVPEDAHQHAQVLYEALRTALLVERFLSPPPRSRTAAVRTNAGGDGGRS